MRSLLLEISTKTTIVAIYGAITKNCAGILTPKPCKFICKIDTPPNIYAPIRMTPSQMWRLFCYSCDLIIVQEVEMHLLSRERNERRFQTKQKYKFQNQKKRVVCQRINRMIFIVFN